MIFNNAMTASFNKIPKWVRWGSLGGFFFLVILLGTMIKYQTDTVKVLGEFELSLDFVRSFMRVNASCYFLLMLLIICFGVLLGCIVKPIVDGLIALLPGKDKGSHSAEGSQKGGPAEETKCSRNDESPTKDENRIVGDLKDEVIDVENGDEQITVCHITLNRDLFKKLFSQDMPDEKFDNMCSKVLEKAPFYCKRNYGELACIIMYQSRYCSSEDKYWRISKIGDKESRCFSPYCRDFFSALGLEYSTTNKSYYETKNDVVLNDFKDILEID